MRYFNTAAIYRIIPFLTLFWTKLKSNGNCIFVFFYLYISTVSFYVVFIFFCFPTKKPKNEKKKKTTFFRNVDLATVIFFFYS